MKFVLTLSRAILRDQQARRQFMFYTVLAAMLMLFVGSTFLQGWLREHLLLLFIYWAACGWLAITAALLAVFDILLIRAASRAARRQLERDYLRERKGERDDKS
jgi:protein-S-isoprenylcysteine O-methyltransferase Ste14